MMAEFVQRQRQGIQTAVAVRFFPRGLVPLGDRLLDELGVAEGKRILLPASDLTRIKLIRAPNNRPIRIFCATRLTWKLPVELGRSTLDYKGSDTMIKGLGLFYRTTGTRLDIKLVRKGLHIKELEMLIAEEGLADQVTWSDEMTLIEVWDRFARSDIVIEQLSNSIIGIAGSDAMATGRPVIGNVQSGWFEAAFGEAAPICQANTPEQVCDQLQRLVFNPEERERIGIAGRRYVERNYDPFQAAEDCLRIFESRRRSPAKSSTRMLARAWARSVDYSRGRGAISLRRNSRAASCRGLSPSRKRLQTMFAVYEVRKKPPGLRDRDQNHYPHEQRAVRT